MSRDIAAGQPREYPLPLRREPSKIQSDADGSNPFSFPRLLQPVLDRNCVACHARQSNAPDLTKGDLEKNRNRWYPSYRNLQGHAFYFNDAVWTTPRTVPGEFGARVSGLYRMLEGGHHDLKLSEEDMHRLTLWLDANSDFFGSYENTEGQARGEIVRPTLE